MKNKHYVLLLLCMSSFLFCNKEKSPTSAAEKFLHEVNKMNYNEAKKYCTEETAKMLDMMANLSKSTPDSIKNKKRPDIIITHTEIYGDTLAIVKYKQENSEEESFLNLRKTDNKWKVSITKNDITSKQPINTDAEEESSFQDSAEVDSTLPANSY